jgi:hypothetical protein
MLRSKDYKMFLHCCWYCFFSSCLCNRFSNYAAGNMKVKASRPWSSRHKQEYRALFWWVTDKVSQSLSLFVCLWLFPLGVREGQSLCTSTTRNRGWAAGTHHCSCQLGHAGYAAESLVRARLSHRCLLSNKRGAHWVCVIPHETVWVYATVATNFVRIFQ